MSPRVRLTGPQQTLLVTLGMHAEESRRRHPVLGDHIAAEITDQIGYRLPLLNKGDLPTVILRAKKFDEWTTAFLDAHPDATVLHLGCGLDSRAFRLAIPAGVSWYDIDLPEVIDLRRELYPSRENYELIASSATNPSWLERIPQDRDTLVIAEGLTPYLPEADGLAMLRRFVERFPRGELGFDAVLPWVAKLTERWNWVAKQGFEFHWSIPDAHRLESQVPGLELLEEWSMYDSPHIPKLPAAERTVFRAVRPIPGISHALRLLHFRF